MKQRTTWCGAAAMLLTAACGGEKETLSAPEAGDADEKSPAAEAARTDSDDTQEAPVETLYEPVSKRRLGPNINTPYAEIFPIAAADGNTLFITRDDYPDPEVMGTISDMWDEAAASCDELEANLDKTPAELRSEFEELIRDCREQAAENEVSRAVQKHNLERSDWPRQVYVAQRLENGEWSATQRMPAPVNDDAFIGNAIDNQLTSVSPDRNTLVMVGMQMRDIGATVDAECSRGLTGVLEMGSRCLAISIITRNGDIWTRERFLRIDDEYSMDLPAPVSAATGPDTEIIVFAGARRVEKEGGGRKTIQDLYVIRRLDNELWSPPKRLDALSTSGVDTSPFIGPDGATLFFASDREGGEGGFDLWMTRRKDETWLAWEEPRNLGPYINTPNDDTSISVDASGRYAFMSSGDGKQQDIYEFDLPPNLSPAPTALVGGRILIGGGMALPDDNGSGELAGGGLLILNMDGPPPGGGSGFDGDGQPRDGGGNSGGAPAGGLVRFANLDGGAGGAANVDPATGAFQVALPVGARYSVYFEAPGFAGVGQTIDLRTVDAFEQYEVHLPVVELCEGAVVRLNNVFFEVDESDLLPASLIELRRLRDLLAKQQEMGVKINGHTDSTNTDDYNQALSERRAQAVMDWLLAEGVEKARLAAEGFGETQPVADNATERGRQLNRRVEFQVTDHPKQCATDL